MVVDDLEFGEILVRKNALCKVGRFSVANSGRLQMTVPAKTPNFMLKRIIEVNRQQIREKLPKIKPELQRSRDQRVKMLKKKAKAFLPYRLAYLAKVHGYKYSAVSLGHQETRWGSCSSNGRIALNYGLMKLPEELRDYVILHELAHLKYPNHSAEFWQEVEKHDPEYAKHRAELKKYQPGII